MQYLKADTNVEVLVGPAVAVGDGFTPVTTLSLSTADEAEIIKYNGATALVVTSISANTMAAITGADGYYTLDLSTGNTDTEGPLTILINDDSLILPIRLDFMVVNANVYDSLFAAAATDYLQTDVIQVSSATEDIATETKQNTAQTDLDTITGAAGVIIDDSAANDTMISDAVWDEDATGHQTQGTFGQAIGDPVADATTIYQAVATDATGDNVAVDVVAVQTDLDNATDGLGAIKATADAVETDTQDIQGRLPAALVNSRMDSTIDATGFEDAAVDKVWDEDIVAAHNTADTAGAILNNILPEKNAAFNNIEWLWVAASDHVTPVTGATTMSVTRSIDGGAFGAGTGTGPTEVSNGIYQYDASAADMNGTLITFRFVATGGTPGAPDDAFVTIKTSG
jgi:hypothetical protein